MHLKKESTWESPAVEDVKTYGMSFLKHLKMKPLRALAGKFKIDFRRKADLLHKIEAKI